MNKKLPHDHGDGVAEQIQINMPKGVTFETVSELFRLMSDGKRVQIFWILCHCEECVINLSEMVDMSSPALSHHLKLLKTAGLVISRREGREVYYTAAQTPRSQILHDMIEHTVELNCPSAEVFSDNHSYDSQIHTVNKIHDLLTDDITARYTVEDLSARFHINQTTLKSLFKTVYGQPITQYMKEYRIRKSMDHLLHTDMPISEIARMVGYENQSKFTEAFKSITGVLPKDYRRSRENAERK